MDTNEFEHDAYFGGLNRRKRKTSKFGVIVLFIVIIVGMYFATKWLDRATDRYIDYRVQQELNK